MAGRGRDSFLVTLWTEGTDDGSNAAPAWRGSVEHLSTRRRLYFSAPSELIGFLGSQMKKAGTRADDQDN
jgi:hypothetical protein